VLVAAAVMTIIVGFTGTVLGFPLALLLGVLGSERVTPFPFNFIFRGTMSTIRAVPSLVWILIYIPLFGISPKSAIFAIATDTIGNLGRLFTDELEEINDGPIEAISSTGANRPQTVIFGMLSQVSSSFIAWTMYVLEINTRIAISLGVVGAGGLGQYISLKIQFGTPEAYAQAAAGLLMVVVIVISVELLSSRIRARLRPGESQDTSIVDAVKGLFDGDKWLGRGDPKNQYSPSRDWPPSTPAIVAAFSMVSRNASFWLASYSVAAGWRQSSTSRGSPPSSTRSTSPSPS